MRIVELYWHRIYFLNLFEKNLLLDHIHTYSEVFRQFGFNSGLFGSKASTRDSTEMPKTLLKVC